VVVPRDRLWKIRLQPKGNAGRSAASTLPPRGHRTCRSTSGYLTSHAFSCGTWKPRTSLTGAKAPASGRAVRRTDRRAGLRCRKKRTPYCNGTDTGCNITGRESEPTSDGCLVARKLDKPSERENADDGRRKAPGALSALDGYGGRRRVSRRSGRSIALAGSCESGLSRGLSCMRRKTHVRFLGEPGARAVLRGPRLTRWRQSCLDGVGPDVIALVKHSA
jgi:hypothetical protein